LHHGFAEVLPRVSSGKTLVLEGNLAQARNVAIANGKRNALETAIAELIPEDVLLENYETINEHVYRHSERFIDTFRILSEGSKENVYEVTLESTIAVERLTKTLIDLGLMEEDLARERSRFRLTVSQVSCGSCFRALQEYLKNEMQGVEEVSLYAISPGRLTLEILYRGAPETFQDAITSKRFQDFRLDPEGMEGKDLAVTMVLVDPEGSWRR
jgi:hypothetical protein